jgi:hypothetical protein
VGRGARPSSLSAAHPRACPARAGTARPVARAALGLRCAANGPSGALARVACDGVDGRPPRSPAGVSPKRAGGSRTAAGAGGGCGTRLAANGAFEQTAPGGDGAPQLNAPLAWMRSMA